MTLEEIVGLLPAEKQGLARDSLKSFVKIESRDDVKKLIIDNQIVKSEFLDNLRVANENHDKKFQEEKLPSIVEEEIKKRGPKPKDPEVAALSDKLAKLESEALELKRSAIRAQQKARAIATLSARGLPDTLADPYLGETDEDTDARLKTFIDSIDPFVKQKVDEGIKGRIGNQGSPNAGMSPTPMDINAKIAEAEKSGNADLLISLLSQKEQMQRFRK